jgi:hypothetical protein
VNDRLIDVKLIHDHSTLTALSAELNSLGGVLICNGCHDVEALVTGIIVFEQDEEAWPFCGECLRRLPLAGSLA